MGLKNSLKNVIEKNAGILILNKTPFGIDPLTDIQNSLGNYSIDTFVDIGANTGQSALNVITKLPRVRIHCVEPFKETYQVLSENLKKYEMAYCYQIAIGDKNGELQIFHGEKDATMCTLNKPADGRASANKVVLQTLDVFCAENRIKHINYLKIDTEGYDLNVLKGAEKILEGQLADFVEIEAGMNPRNAYHVPLFDMKIFLENCGYLMFGIYDQVQEWIEKKPYLRRCNAVFISSNLADKSFLT